MVARRPSTTGAAAATIPARTRCSRDVSIRTRVGWHSRLARGDSRARTIVTARLRTAGSLGAAHVAAERRLDEGAGDLDVRDARGAQASSSRCVIENACARAPTRTRAWCKRPVDGAALWTAAARHRNDHAHSAATRLTTALDQPRAVRTLPSATSDIGGRCFRPASSPARCSSGHVCRRGPRSATAWGRRGCRGGCRRPCPRCSRRWNGPASCGCRCRCASRSGRRRACRRA